MTETNNKNKNFILELEDKVYITRKCRINAADRHKKSAKFFSCINFYYSVLLIVISIVAITDSSTNINIFLICSSISAFAINVIIILQDPKSIYIKYKENYINLDSLYRRINSSLQSLSVDEYIVFSREYEELLNACPNHEEIDYFKVLLSDDFQMKKAIETKKTSKGKVRFLYYSMKIFIGVKNVLFIVVPFIIPFAIKLISLLLSVVEK